MASSLKARGIRTSTAHPPHPQPEEAPLQAPHKLSKMGVHRIVRLWQMVQHWRRRAATNLDRTLPVMSPHGRKLLHSSSSCSSSSSSAPSSSSSSSSSSSCCGREHDLPPEGYLTIYVGREQRRFIIRTEHINHPLLCGLLERTEEEFGLNPLGGLAIPGCEVVLFEHMLWMVENHDVHTLDDPAELLDLYMHIGPSASNCLQEANRTETPSNNILEPISRCPHAGSR